MTTSSSGPADTPGFGPAGAAGPPGERFESCPLTEDDLAAYLAATAEDEPPEEYAAFLIDPGADPPAGEDRWLDQLLQEQSEETLAEKDEPAGSLPPGAAGYQSAGSDWPGFGSGSWLDQLEPGPVLTAALEDAHQAGLGQLSDDALTGVMLAGRRLESRGTATLLTAIAELARRREATSDPRVAEHTGTEVAMLLATSRRAGERLVGFATDLAQLPATSAALWDGKIDRVKADIIAYETGMLDPELAAAVEQLVIEDAPRLTPSQLRARLHRAVIAADPTAARRRAAQAARDARVELFPERSGGTAALSGRDLPVPATVAADQRIDATARAYKAAGAAATLAQLRAAVFLGLLTDADPLSCVPADTDDTCAPTQDRSTRDTSTAADASVQPGSVQPGSVQPGSVPEPQATPTGRATAPAPAADAATGTATAAGAATAPAPAAGPGLGTSSPPADRGWPGKLTLRGSVHLTMPLASWLGTTRSPGEIAAFGPVTAETCQELADWIAASPGSRWCLTLTDKDGHAVGHACARRPPPPRTDPQRLAAWLARLKVRPIEAGSCTHAREVPGYRIPESLHHAVKVRQKTCANPICTRPAQSCDDDHTVPYHKGGRTCECGLGPVCRCCHRTKQTPGWRLEQPSPGVLVWHLPNGRSVVATPGVYPT